MGGQFGFSPSLPSILLLHLQRVADEVGVAAVTPLELETVGGCGEALQPRRAGGQGTRGHLGGRAVGAHADAVHSLDADSATRRW